MLAVVFRPVGSACIWGCLFALVGCSALKPAEPDPTTQLTQKPIPPEKAPELAQDVASNWFYGQGLGDTAITVGTVVAFPPYLVVVLGNAALSLSEYEPVTVSSLLPEKTGEAWKQGYDSIASAPGKVTAAAAGKEFRTPEVIKEEITEKYLKADQPVTVAKNEQGQ